MDEKDALPVSQKLFGNIVYWVSILSTIGALIAPIFILARPANNVLNPNLVFNAIFRGACPEEIWGYTEAGVFPGAHYYFEYFGLADSFAMLIIVIGCAVALFGFIPAIAYQVFKEKDWFCAVLGSAIVVLILLSMFGLI